MKIICIGSGVAIHTKGISPRCQTERSMGKTWTDCNMILGPQVVKLEKKKEKRKNGNKSCKNYVSQCDRLTTVGTKVKLYTNKKGKQI